MFALIPAAAMTAADSSTPASDLNRYEEPSTLEVDDSINKAGVWCNSEGYYCIGTFGELIDHLRTSKNGLVEAWATDEVNQAVTAGTVCTLSAEVFIEVRAAGGDKTVLEQLYLTKLSGGKVAIRLASADGTPSGTCRVSYIRALYSE